MLGLAACWGVPSAFAELLVRSNEICPWSSADVHTAWVANSGLLPVSTGPVSASFGTKTGPLVLVRLSVGMLPLPVLEQLQLAGSPLGAAAAGAEESAGAIRRKGWRGAPCPALEIGGCWLEPLPPARPCVSSVLLVPLVGPMRAMTRSSRPCTLPLTGLSCTAAWPAAASRAFDCVRLQTARHSAGLFLEGPCALSSSASCRHSCRFF